MIAWKTYGRLLRLDKPVGILLLWYPTAWALWIANEGSPPWKVSLLLLLGVFIMRSAGCVFNDIADRQIDKQVSRTKLRPLAAGEVGLLETFLLLFILLSAALWVVIYLPVNCFILSLFALSIVWIYPFGKRWLKAPQMVLGVAFSMGIPMAYLASGKPLDSQTMTLFFINFAWIIAYDTMYAMTDKEDDLRIGVKSTAIYFADYDRVIIGILLFFLQASWLCWALLKGANFGFYGFWLAAAWVLVYQHHLIHARIPKECFKAFRVSVYYGFLIWMAVICAY